MPFDAITMAAVRDELETWGRGGQIQRIVQPSAAAVALQVHSHGESRWIVASAEARFARVGVTAERVAKAFPTPSSFVMLLRKHLEGVRIAGVDQEPYERVLRIDCGPEERRTHLVVEVMGKHSNVVLTDSDRRILGALKVVTHRQSRVRPVLPGHAYTPPPPRDRDSGLFGSGLRPDPRTEPDTLVGLLTTVPPGTSCAHALLGLLPGASPFLVRQICTLADADPDSPLEPGLVDSLHAGIRSMYDLYDSRAWRSCTFRDERDRLDFAPYFPRGVTDVREVSEIGEAIEMCYGGQESRDALSSVRAAIESEIDRAQRSAERKVRSLWEGLEAAEDADAVMQQGQLVLAYQWAAIPGADRLDIPELEMSIPLDPSLSIQDSAERLFRRYRKLRDAARRLPQLIAEAETEEARLHDLHAFVRLADSEAALRELQRQVVPQSAPSTGKKRAARKGPLRLKREAVRVILGRNARENEEVTFRLARREDTWFHARERTGAHVVAATGGENLEPQALEAIAALAAYYSEGRPDTAVDIDVAAVRDVRKIPGGPPGRVTYRNFRTVRVAPSKDGWEAE